jgi:hypothetical protein
MKLRCVAILAMLFLTAAGAGAEINLGAGTAVEAGNSPLSLITPQIFVENIYHVGSWETFGIDFVIGGSPSSNASYTNGLSAGPELFFGADMSYHFPYIGPVELAVLLGGWGFQDYENRVNGVGAQTGLAATVHFGSIFVQGRGLYRFYSSTGFTGAPVPLGVFSFAILGGYSFF